MVAVAQVVALVVIVLALLLGLLETILPALVVLFVLCGRVAFVLSRQQVRVAHNGLGTLH